MLKASSEGQSVKAIIDRTERRTDLLRSELTVIVNYSPLAIIVGRLSLPGLGLPRLGIGGGGGQDGAGEGGGGHAGVPSADDHLGLSAPEFRFPKFNNSKVSVNKHTKMLTHNYLR